MNECGSCCSCDEQEEMNFCGSEILPWHSVTEQLCKEFQRWHMTGAGVRVHTGLLCAGFSVCVVKMPHIVISMWIAHWTQQQERLKKTPFHWPVREVYQVMSWWDTSYPGAGNHKVLTDFDHWKLLCLVRDAPKPQVSHNDGDVQVTSASSLQVQTYVLFSFCRQSSEISFAGTII